MNELSIRLQWESALHGDPEVRDTSALLAIEVGGRVMTTNEDDWSRTIRDDVRLSAYPLALWLAGNWWRLRYEPLPLPVSRPSHSWRMAHEMAAAGHGFVWPRMLFASDGESTHVWSVSTSRSALAPVGYLANAHELIPVSAFERGTDAFVRSVLARLDAMGHRGTDLHGLWLELAEERADAALHAGRRLEAMLGFDPDACPEPLLERFERLGHDIGAAALEEIAPLCAGTRPDEALDRIVELSTAAGIDGRIELGGAGDVVREPASPRPAWDLGHEAARALRRQLGLDGQPVEDRRLADLLGADPATAFDPALANRAPLGLAVRGAARGSLRIIPRKRNRPGRRFELARFLGDYLSSRGSGAWLPATDAHTARQQYQRAFAAEFLCPIGPLAEFLAGDLGPAAIDDAAEHFAVSERAVETQLVNHRLLPAGILEDGSAFPYVM